MSNADKVLAFTYARVSTVEQATEEATSLGEQEASTSAHIVGQGWEHGGHFADPGVSGAKPFAERPGGAGLLDAVAAAQRDGRKVRVVALKVDRLTRSLRHGAKQLGEWHDEGVGFVSVRESFDTGTPQGRMFLNILMTFAEFEREQIAERNAGGRRAIVASEDYRDESGRVWRWTGGHLPYGYATDDDKRIVADEDAAANVARVFELRGLGWSSTRIASTLNDEGRKTRPRKGKGRSFTEDIVAKVLDPTKGHYLGDGIERRLSKGEAPVLFAAPALIEPDAFAKAARGAVKVQKVPKAGEKVRRYALSNRISHRHQNGKVSGMFGLARPSKGLGEVRFYRCLAARKTPSTPATCDGLGVVNSQEMTSVNADQIEAVILRALYSTSAEEWETLLKAKAQAAKAATATIDRDALRAEAAKLNRRRSNLVDMRADGDIDRDEFRAKVETIDARLAAIDSTIEAADSEVAHLDTIREAVEGLKVSARLGGLTIPDTIEGAEVRPRRAWGDLHPAESDAALLAAVSKVLDSPPDHYGRTPLLPEWAVEVCEGWANTLDIEVTVERGDDARRPHITVTLAGEVLQTPPDAWGTPLQGTESVKRAPGRVQDSAGNPLHESGSLRTRPRTRPISGSSFATRRRATCTLPASICTSTLRGVSPAWESGDRAERKRSPFANRSSSGRGSGSLL